MAQKIQYKKFHFYNIERSNFDIETWSKWTWQMQNAIESESDFAKYFDLSEDERTAFRQGQSIFNIRATPYYATLAKAVPHLRKILVPQIHELQAGTQQMLDPLGERENNPAPRLIHRYPDRVLFLITDTCSVYCRFCTRKHFTGQEQAFIKSNEYKQSIDYIKKHPGLREVILSGGDPLTLSDGILNSVLSDLRAIDHIEIIRIGTRMPVVCPMRITDELAKILQKHNPVYIMNHFNHPDEITVQSAEALTRLADHGLPMMNQMVFLNGVNNHAALVQALNRRLLYLRVKPYYMFQCDPSLGTDHLRTSLQDSLDIQKQLWGNLSGLAMPNLSVDIPNGGGKTYYVPNFETHREEEKIFYQGWDGVKAHYANPPAENILKPHVADEYIAEWESLKSAKNL
ncbi:MAG: KamA family radical SAM protein [Pseudobdellovibrionaceae bacterium]